MAHRVHPYFAPRSASGSRICTPLGERLPNVYPTRRAAPEFVPARRAAQFTPRSASGSRIWTPLGERLPDLTPLGERLISGRNVRFDYFCPFGPKCSFPSFRAKMCVLTISAISRRNVRLHHFGPKSPFRSFRVENISGPLGDRFGAAPAHAETPPGIDGCSLTETQPGIDVCSLTETPPGVARNSTSMHCV